MSTKISILLAFIVVFISLIQVHSGTTTTTPVPGSSTTTSAGGSTTAGPCKDNVLYCKDALRHCKEKKVKKTLKENCARTCGFCQSTECEDIDQDACRQWNRNGFCESPFFKEKVKIKKCKRTCKLCD